MTKCTANTLKGLQCTRNSKSNGLCGIHIKDRKVIPPKAPKEKSSLKKTEDINVSKIVDMLRLNNSILRTEFTKITGKHINGVRKSGGTRADHYDFEIYIRGEGWKKVEHKGSETIKDFGEKPWSSGVQFYNGTGSLFSIGKKYAREFYDRYIGSKLVSEKYDIETPIPEYSIWESAIFSQGHGSKLDFIKELRKKTVEGKPPRRQGLYRERDEFTGIFNTSLTQEDLDCLKNEINEMICQTMCQKDYWLQVHGDLNGEFRVKWTQNNTINPVSEIKIAKSTDCTYQLLIPNTPSLQAKLRWGYNHGISNLRLDLK